MSHSRKLILTLAAVTSFLGLAGSASAQSNPYICTSSFSPLVVRIEGLTELLGDIVIRCSGGNAVGDPGNPPSFTTGNQLDAVNISVSLPTQFKITNRFLSNNLTDAVLLIDDPTNPAPGATTQNQNACGSGSPGTTTGNGTGNCSTNGKYLPFAVGGVVVGAQTGSVATYVVNEGVGNNGGRPVNVFQGQFGVGGGFNPNDSTITFVGVPIVPTGNISTFRTYRIKNIRAQVAPNGSLNGSINASISIQNPPANLVLTNNTGVVGFVQQGLIFTASSAGTFAQCLGWNQGVTSGSGTLTAGFGSVTFREAYGVAFKRRGYNPAQASSADQFDPTLNYNTESGFYNSTFGGNWINSSGPAGVASNGTRLRAKFSAVPTGVSVYVTNYSYGTSGTALGAAYGTSGGDSGTGAFSATNTLAFAANSTTSGSAGYLPRSGVIPSFPSGTGTPGFVAVPLTSGAGSFTWEVINSDDNAVDILTFGVAIAFAPTTSIVTDTATGVTATVSGNFAPIGGIPVGNVFPDIPRFILSQPEDPKTIFIIGNCATNLLYPFVSSRTGFNTGVAVSNTSDDTGTGFGTVKETGICRVFYYGTTEGGGAAPSPVNFSKSVAAGDVATFNLLFGSTDYGINPVVGFQGYLIIRCNFRWAHGFAFISDPSNLQTAHGYLALVLDQGTLQRNTGATSERLVM